MSWMNYRISFLIDFLVRLLNFSLFLIAIQALHRSTNAAVPCRTCLCKVGIINLRKFSEEFFFNFFHFR